VQDLSAVKESRLPVPEDRAAREALERKALNKCRHQQSLEGLPIEESPSETVSGEDEDSGNDDAGSRYDTVTFLAHLPYVWPLLEPIGGGSTSQASREVSAPVEGEGVLAEGRAREGPSERGSALPGVPQGTSVVPRP
jgi:hypothetical protein